MQMKFLVSDRRLYHANHTCQVFTLEVTPKFHFSTAHLKEMKVWGIELKS
jgi:hypothetical protein